MKATCPNSPDHKRFYTMAHMSETWVVDERGNWVETTDDPGEIVAPPHKDNTWQCVECGANAVVTDVVEARSVTVKDDWGVDRVVGGFGDVGGPSRDA